MIGPFLLCVLLGEMRHALASDGTSNLRGAAVSDARDELSLWALEPVLPVDSKRELASTFPDTGAVIKDDMNFLDPFEGDRTQIPEEGSGSASETEQEVHRRDLEWTTAELNADEGGGWYDENGEKYGEGEGIQDPFDGNQWAASVAAHEMDEGADKLIVGGNFMNKGQRNFCMALDRQDTGQGAANYVRGYCGGTLISDRWILTAGHCLSNQYENDLRNKFDACYMNAYKPWTNVNVNGEIKRNGGEDFQVIEIDYCVEHPYHSPGGSSPWDFALCKLKSNAHPSLPRAPIADNSYVSGIEPGKYMRTVGLGQTSYQGSKAGQLKEVYVPLVPDNVCRSILSQYPASAVDDTMICAGGEGGKDACGGDSGGPLFDGDVLVGVTSWGYKCAVKGVPGVYARAGKVIEWISEQENMQVSCHVGIALGGKGLGGENVSNLDENLYFTINFLSQLFESCRYLYPANHELCYTTYPLMRQPHSAVPSSILSLSFS